MERIELKRGLHASLYLNEPGRGSKVFTSKGVIIPWGSFEYSIEGSTIVTVDRKVDLPLLSYSHGLAQPLGGAPGRYLGIRGLNREFFSSETLSPENYEEDVIFPPYEKGERFHVFSPPDTMAKLFGLAGAFTSALSIMEDVGIEVPHLLNHVHSWSWSGTPVYNWGAPKVKGEWYVIIRDISTAGKKERYRENINPFLS